MYEQFLRSGFCRAVRSLPNYEKVLFVPINLVSKLKYRYCSFNGKFLMEDIKTNMDLSYTYYIYNYYCLIL